MSTLRWRAADGLPDDVRTRLFGPGAPFERAVEEVLGGPVEVFVRRPRSLHAVLAQAAVEHGDRSYLAFPEVEIDYATADRMSGQVATVLADRYGIGPGARVGIVSANTLGYALTAWATVRLGAIVTGLNGWWTAAELAHGIALSEPSVIAADAPRRARLAELGDAVAVPVIDLEELLAAATDAPVAEAVPVDEDDPAVILFTSGTTGRAKGATLTHRNLVHLGLMGVCQGAVGVAVVGGTGRPGVQPSSIAGGPFFHVSGLARLLGAPFTGGKIVIPGAGRWDEATHLELTERHRVTSWSGVPTQYWRLLQHSRFDEYDLSSLRMATAGGANFAPELVRLFQQKLPAVSLGNGYGMTETTGMATYIGGAEMLEHPESVGRAQPTSEVGVRAPDGEPVPDGEVGEIHVRHAGVFAGYWNDPESTAAALEDGRWYRSGDFGRVVDGRLHLESRMRDLVIRGGENIYPVEIENRLVAHGGIDDAAVIGVPHRELGQEVAAFVVARPGHHVDADEVRRWVGEALAPFKVPAHVRFVDGLPYTESGKLRKNVLEADWTSAGGTGDAR